MPVCTSHIITVVSCDPLTTRVPSGEYATEITSPECPVSGHSRSWPNHARQHLCKQQQMMYELLAQVCTRLVQARYRRHQVPSPHNVPGRAHSQQRGNQEPARVPRRNAYTVFVMSALASPLLHSRPHAPAPALARPAPPRPLRGPAAAHPRPCGAAADSSCGGCPPAPPLAPAPAPAPGA